MPVDRAQMAQGNAVPLTEEDQQRDDVGFTNPNLHRRVDPQPVEGEYQLREYDLFVNGTDSYRTTESFLRDENDDTVDIVP